MMVETIVMEKNLTYIDAVVYLCTENRMEIEDINKFLNDSIKKHLEAEAMNLNFLPKLNTLDV